MIADQLRRALAANLGRVLTPEVASDIEAKAGSPTAQPDTSSWPAYSDASLLDLMAGNADAARLMRMLSSWSHVYDDLIDKDKPVSDERIHGVMWMLLFDLPANPFYRQHEAMFRPVLMAGILNWHAANQMEHSGSLEQLRIAHAVRYSIGDVAYLAMVLTGGLQHAIDHAARCRLMLQQDTWANYSKEHGHDGAE